jgi:hypothetical protein
VAAYPSKIIRTISQVDRRATDLDTPLLEGMKHIKRSRTKLSLSKLTLAKEKVMDLTSDQLREVAGGRPQNSFSCINLCISINAC